MAMYDAPRRAPPPDGVPARQRPAHDALGRGRGAARRQQRQPGQLRLELQLHQAPARRPATTAARRGCCDMWGCANSQETVGVSPEMFHEFCFPYYRDVLRADGPAVLRLLRAGPPVLGRHQQPAAPQEGLHLPLVRRAHSWARRCAAPGSSSRASPTPTSSGVDVKLDEEAWAAHIRETLDAARGVLRRVHRPRRLHRARRPQQSAASGRNSTKRDRQALRAVGDYGACAGRGSPERFSDKAFLTHRSAAL